jgi:hypothetical protein
MCVQTTLLELEELAVSDQQTIAIERDIDSLYESCSAHYVCLNYQLNATSKGLGRFFNAPNSSLYLKSLTIPSYVTYLAHRCSCFTVCSNSPSCVAVYFINGTTTFTCHLLTATGNGFIASPAVVSESWSAPFSKFSTCGLGGEVSGCVDILGNLAVVKDLISSIASPLLTRVKSDLTISSNRNLKTIIFSSLTSIGGSWLVYNNSAMTITIAPLLTSLGGDLAFYANALATLLSVPQLTYIKGTISICQNGASFVIPSTAPNAPGSGLTSATKAGMNECRVQNGDGQCPSEAAQTCP